MRRTNRLLLLSTGTCAVLLGCPMSNGPLVDNPRPAETCFLRSELAENRVYQSTAAGCAFLSVSAIWDESTPPHRGDGPIQQSGVRSATRIFFSRESCERVQALGTSEEAGGVRVQLPRTGSGFIAATLVEPASVTSPGEVLLSVSLDFTVDGVDEVQTVRILDLPLAEAEVCTTF